jgi:alpha-tubulin suppressor-like RCC1 family protein
VLVIRTNKIVIFLLTLSLIVQLFGMPFLKDSIISAEERIVVPGIVTGANATLFLTPEGKVRATGYPAYGETGVGSVATPTEISGLINVKQVALKNATSFALLNDGTVKSWGYGGNYELGSGVASNRSVPTVIPNLTNVKQIEAGSNFAVALLKNGTVKAWGYNNFGQVGNGTATTVTIPTLITGLTDVKKISVGENYVLALLNNGRVMAWGLNSYGQLGLGAGDLTNRNVPTLIPNLTNIKDISAGYTHSLAIASDGTVKAWGANSNGQLGTGSITTYSSVPVSAANLTNVIQISAGNAYSMALHRDGTPRVWGNSANYQLGLGTTGNTLTPTAITTISDAAQVIAGNANSFITMNDYAVKGVGSNTSYKLGNGNNATQTSLVDISGLKAMTVPVEMEIFDPIGVEIVSSSNSRSSFILEKGRIKAWGNNDNGQLGLGDTKNRIVPTPIMGLIGVKQMATGQSHTMALMEDGTVKAWGDNLFGQLGLGNKTSGSTPITIAGLNGVQQLIAGQYHTLALMEDGTVKAWGDNSYGQLGIGSATGPSTLTA